MQKLHKVVRFSLYLGFCLAFIGASFAQNTNSGDIRGVVTDRTGAVIQGATVTVVNVNTGISKDYVTNQDGLFDTGPLVVGSYQLKFVTQGFEQLARGPITVQVGNTTINAELKPGSTQQVERVTADVPLLQLDSGEQSTTIPSKQLQALPQVGQDWQNFIVLIPGSAGVSGSNAANPGQVASINGNMPYSNILSDGSSVTLPHSLNVNYTDNLESVAEVRINASSFSAQYGIGGIIFNQISKGGTSRFHGSAYDYFQNNALNAAPYGFGNIQTVPYLRYNDFGGSISGPVWLPILNLKKKAFFYFNYDRIVNHGAAGNTTTTVPTAAVMNGDFSGQRILYDPTTQTFGTDASGHRYPIRKSFLSEYGSNAIPANLFDSVAQKFQQFWPTATNHNPYGRFVPGQLNSLGILTNNWFASVPNSAPVVKYFGRLDYDITPSNRLTMTNVNDDAPSLSINAVTSCPLGCSPGDLSQDNAQVTDVWNINSHLINEARIGYTFDESAFTDQSLNKGYAKQLGWQFAKADDAPSIVFAAVAAHSGGSGQVAAPYASIGPATNSAYVQHAFDISDVVTMIQGRHILHFGGELLIYRDDSTPWGNINAGQMSFTGQYTQNWTLDANGNATPDSNTGAEYADFLLGQVQSWSAQVSPEYGGRLKSPQFFVQDDYKVRPNFTLNLGLRYQINHGWNEVRGNIASFDPTLINPATNTPGAMWYATTHANGRTSLQANVFNDVMPRVGFSWAPHPDMTVRGGFGVYSYNWSLDQYGNTSGQGMGGSFGATGNVQDLTNGQTPVVKLDSDGANLPYKIPSTDPARFNGQSVGYYQYHTPIPKIDQWNLAVQRQFGENWAAELAYVASHGFNLPFPTSLNQVPENKLGPDDAAFLPYPQYAGVSGSTNNAISNYNSLQATITRRMSSGLEFSFNYVWSHFMDDQDSSGWAGYAGSQPYQIANNPGANYANSNFDTPNAFKGQIIYQLPFGRGRQFLNTNRVVDSALGGWNLSAIVILVSGQPFTLTDNGTTYAQAGVQFPNRNPGVSIYPHNRSIHEWYNPAAFTLPANGTFGNVGRNSVFGPGVNLVNLSGGKTFSIRNGVTFEMRVDATNAFNHPSFTNPNASLSGASGPGQPFTSLSNITGVQVGGRSVQLKGRLQF